MDRARTALIWRGVFAGVGWLALAGQFVVFVEAWTLAAVLERLEKYFSYFTILTNILVALALTLPLLAGASRAGVWSRTEAVRAGVTMYALVVGVIYHLLLRATWEPQGFQIVTDTLLHTVMPLAILIDWVAFTPKGRLRWLDAGKWLAFPLAFGAWSLLHGAIGGWYPYWFIDVGELGYARVLLNLGGLLVFFALVGLIVVAIDRTLGRRDRTAASA
jgi:hypothetical protein